MATTYDHYKYSNPTGSKFPIMAKFPLPSDYITDLNKYIKNDPAKADASMKELIQTAIDCGLNVFIVGGSFDIMDVVIKQATDLNFNIILSPVWLHENTVTSHSVIEKYYNYSLVTGYEVFDQPHFQDWGNVFYPPINYNSDDSKIDELYNYKNDLIWNRLSIGYKMVIDCKPKYPLMPYFHLAAPHDDTEKRFIGSCNSYDEYLKALSLMYNPPLWSYEFFPFVRYYSDDSANTAGPVTVKYDPFFKYLGRFSNLYNDSEYKKENRPFWAYCLAQGHYCYVKDLATGAQRKIWETPTPDEGMLRFEAFNALAFGAKGIAYWGYGQMNSFDREDGTSIHFNRAPVYNEIFADSDKYFRKSIVWSAIKSVNAQINKFASIFMNGIVTNCFHIGQSFAGQKLYSGEYIACFTSIYASGMGVLISMITKGTENYMVVVNHDPFNEIKVTFKYQATRSVEFLTHETRSEVAEESDGSKSVINTITRTITLDKGDWIIIKYGKASIAPPIDPILPR